MLEIQNKNKLPHRREIETYDIEDLNIEEEVEENCRGWRLHILPDKLYEIGKKEA